MFGGLVTLRGIHKGPKARKGHKARVGKERKDRRIASVVRAGPIGQTSHDYRTPLWGDGRNHCKKAKRPSFLIMTSL